MNIKERINILNIFQKFYPNPKIGLIYKTNFELLISIILSAKSTDIQVNNVTKKLFKNVHCAKDMLNLGKKKIQNNICSIGLWKKKTIYILKTCHILVNIYNQNIPNTKKELLLLPGVGSKTANIFLNTIFKKKYIAVDTHVFRVCNRTGFVTGNSVSIIEKKLTQVVPNTFKIFFHNWCILHGRYICKSVKPQCSLCCIYQHCEYVK